jgi:hypothetical protein
MLKLNRIKVMALLRMTHLHLLVYIMKLNFHQPRPFLFKFLCVRQSTQTGDIPEYGAEEGIMIYI